MCPREEDKSIFVEKAEGRLQTTDCDADIIRLPTTEERLNLREVSDSLPWSAYALCLFVCIQWGASSGAGAVLYNFLQFPLPKGGSGTGATPSGTQQTPGALGFGLQKTYAISTSIQFFSPFLQFFGAWLADVKLGRFKVLMLATGVSCIYTVLFVVSGVPSNLRHGNSVAPFLIGFCLREILATPLYGPVVSPIIMDQYTRSQDYVKTLPSGKFVVVSRQATLSRLQWLFYGIGNIGPFLAIGTTWAEKRIGFWLAFTVPCTITFFLPLILLLIHPHSVQIRPDGKQLSQAGRILWIVLRREKWRLFFRADAWNTAKPSVLTTVNATTNDEKHVSWDDAYVDQISDTWAACKIFFFFIIYGLTGGGIGVIGSSQASSMTTNGVPNDLLESLNSIATVVLMPILTYGLFPLLRRRGIRFGRISRMTVGFFFGSVSSLYGAILQWRVYKTSPCGYHATGCNVGSLVSEISVWVRSPIPVLNALSQLLTWTGAYEVAYIQSPSQMKSIVLAVLLFTGIFNNAISTACAPAIKDPYLIWVWAIPGLANLIQTGYFHWNYQHFDAEHSTIKHE